MKQFKGTPGPWEIGGRLGNDKDSHSDFLIIAQSCIVVDGCGCCGSPYLGGETEDEQLANVRLIAAAPKLLDVLLQALPYVREQAKSDGHAFGTLQLMNNVIKEILGEA